MNLLTLPAFNLRPIGQREKRLPSPPQADGSAINHRLDNTAVITYGGFGKAVGMFLYALARSNGFELPILSFDNDASMPDAILHPSGAWMGLPTSAFVPIGVNKPRDALKEEPLLVKRYHEGGLLRGISVFESAGFGGGGFPIISAIDIDLSIRPIKAALEEFLRHVSHPKKVTAKKDFFQTLKDGKVATDNSIVTPMKIVHIGGGAGSMGAASHKVFPYVVRSIINRLRLPEPLQIGCVAGPYMFRGLTPRTLTNWRATVAELQELTDNGLKGWEFIDGSVIDDDSPGYSRIVLFDDEPAREKASDAELRRFESQVAKTLFAALASDLFERLEQLEVNDRRHPWTTLQGVLAQADWTSVQPMALANLAANRLATLMNVAAQTL